ncbi:MAG: penicillin-binding transpeptidase domain-containing protein, partial [Polyangiaceae bacterium]
NIDSFEPGSTFKVFAMATALAAKSVRPTDTIYCEEGRMPIDNVVIHDTHPSKWLNPTQIIQISSNIGIAKISLGLGGQKLYEGLRRFGFGTATALPLPGRVSGTLRPRGRPWVPVETAAAAFGQGVSVTNVQLTMALAALANKGRLLEPIIVKKITDSTGIVLHEASPKVRRRVVSPRIARLLAEMMSSVTEGEGTGIEAAIPGFRVAGKTATAQKIDPATGRYNDTHYVASFMGFVPAARPRLVVSVVIDEPMAGKTSGGSVAGPVFRRVVEMSLRYLGVRPRGTRSMNLAKLAKTPKERKGTNAAARVTEPVPVAAYTGRGGVRVPKLQGQAVRSAVQALVEAGLIPVVRGSGRLARTEPPTGTRVARGSKVTLVFEPQT